MYAEWSRMSGQFDQAVRLAEEALELDPTHTNSLAVLGHAQRYARDYEGAAASYRASLDLKVDWGTHYHLATLEAMRGNVTEALEHLTIMEELAPLPSYARSSGVLSQRALIYAMVDRPDDVERYRVAFEALEESGDRVPPPAYAIMALALGQNDDALDYLREISAMVDRLGSGGNLEYALKYNAWNLPILETPEFVEVRAQLGQPEF